MKKAADKNIKVLLLDEPESGLDQAQATENMTKLIEAAKDKIIIVISHYDATQGLASQVVTTKAPMIAQDSNQTTHKDHLDTAHNQTWPSNQQRYYGMSLGGKDCSFSRGKYSLSIPKPITFFPGLVYRIKGKPLSGKTSVLNFLHKPKDFNIHGPKNFNIHGNFNISFGAAEFYSPYPLLAESHIISGSVQSWMIPASSLHSSTHEFYKSIIDCLAIKVVDKETGQKRPLKPSDTLGLMGFKLSDGQLCKLGMGRCLARNTALVLLDCPEVGLSHNEIAATLKRLFDMARKNGQTVVFAANCWDKEWDKSLVDVVLEIEDGQLRYPDDSPSH